MTRLPKWEPQIRPSLTAEHGWLAGIIDGEGCIYTRRPGSKTPSVELTVGMTHEPSVRKCFDLTGVGTLSERSMKHRIKTLYMWCSYSNNAKDVLWLILPCW